MSRALALVALASVAACGCGSARTEAVVRVSAEGLRVPDDIDAVHIQVFDAQQSATSLLFDMTLVICTDAVKTGCVPLPMTATLIPGAMFPRDSTRVLVAAQRGGVDRIDDAALFTFVPGESLLLDFVLYGNCLDKLDCAVMNQACGPNRGCQPVPAQPFTGNPDFSVGAAPQDLSFPGGAADLTTATDLRTPPPDLTGVDLFSCSHVCPAGSCNTFNACGEPCNTCNSANQVCSGTSCVACGNSPGAPCCAGALCTGQLDCNASNVCECGNLHEFCCAGGAPCNNALGCTTGTCEPDDGGVVMPPPDRLLATWDLPTFMQTAPPEFFGVSTMGMPAMASGGGPVTGTLQAMAVGTGGVAFTLTGAPNTWSQTSSTGTTQQLNRVWMCGPGAAYAVGNGGVLTYWSGAAWQTQTLTFTAGFNLTGVWCRAGEVWLSGAMGSTGLVAHNGSATGGSWDTGTLTSPPFAGVWSDGSNSALVAAQENSEYLASDNGPITTQALGFAGTAGIVARKVWAASLSSAWFVTEDGGIFYYDGATVTQDQAPITNVSFRGISGVGAGTSTELWAVGLVTGPTSTSPVLYHASGLPPHTWTAQTNLPALAPNGAVFDDVAAVGARDVFIVGSSAGVGVILHGHTP